MISKNDAVSNLNKNINYIKTINGLRSDSDLCRAAGISKGTMSSVRQEGKLPMLYPFFERLCNYSGFTVDALICSDLETEILEAAIALDETKDQIFRAYEGVYAAYYFNTSGIKGRERRNDDEAVKYAVLLIYRDEDRVLRCIGDFSLSREDQFERFHACFGTNENGQQIRLKNYKSEFVNRFIGDDLYEGTFEIHENSILIKLESSQDSLTMMLNRIRKTPSRFVGGLAAAISECTGVHPEPVMQVIGLSRGLLTESAAQIARKLYFNYPLIECRPEDEKEIYEMLRFMVDGHEAVRNGGPLALTLTREQENAILLDAMNRAINRTVKRNLGRTVQVTAADDEEWYYMTRRFEEV